jgi:hypothetical protein
MKVHCCDKCRKPINGGEPLPGCVLTVRSVPDNQGFSVTLQRRWELCDECALALGSWLGPNPTEEII